LSTVMGIRCWGDRFTYVVLSGTIEEPRPKSCELVRLAVNDARPAQLAGFRQDVYDVLTQQGVLFVCFRSPEPIARAKSLPRAEIEGILQEVCHSHSPRVRIVGRTVKQLKSVLNFQGPASNVFRLSERSEFLHLGKTNYAEAIVAALSALVNE